MEGVLSDHLTHYRMIDPQLSQSRECLRHEHGYPFVVDSFLVSPEVIFKIVELRL